MKKVVIGLMALTLLAVPVLTLAQSQTAPDPALPGQPAADSPRVDVMRSLDNIINWLFGILLVVAVLFLMLAAYFFVTSQGDAEKVKTARNFVLYALIGVAVAIAARGLVYLIQVVVRT